MNLRIPGPTECPQEVLDAMGKQMISHRGPEFAKLLKSVTERDQRIFQTQNDLLTLTTSGTGGMEAAIASFFSPGDKILATTIGYFGDRWVEIARRYKLNVVLLAKPWGTDIAPEELDRKLRRHPDAKTVLITHNETSTGVTNNLEELARVVRKYGKLIFVDAVSSMAAIPVLTDKWGLDVVVTASQKGFMCPPGLAMVSVSKSAWKLYERSKKKRGKVVSYTLDLGLALDNLKKWQTPSTPAISTLYALDKALDLIIAEGLENVFLRHKGVAELCRRGVATLGWPLFAEPHCASDAVTAVTVPPPLDAASIIKRLREKYGIIVAGGMKDLSGKIIRIGHVGYVDESDIDQVIDALKDLSRSTIEYT